MMKRAEWEHSTSIDGKNILQGDRLMLSFFSSRSRAKGQGLVEYAIFLALVTIVVIAVVRILGPSVGNVFNNINDSHASTPIWTFAADEGGIVNVPVGVHQIQYGANGSYYTQTFTGPTTVICNNSTFGDPVSGTAKTCFIQ